MDVHQTFIAFFGLIGHRDVDSRKRIAFLGDKRQRIVVCKGRTSVVSILRALRIGFRLATRTRADKPDYYCCRQ